jgi:hypothetical protein
MSPMTESTCGFVEVVDAERLLLREVLDSDMEWVGDGDASESDNSIACCLFFVSCHWMTSV